MKENKRRVKNILVEQEFMDILEQELLNAPSTWLLINYDNYKELHYEDSIYRFFDAKKLIDLRKVILESNKDFFCFDTIQETKDIDLTLKQAPKEKKERPSYKKLNKKMIKSMTKKVNTRGY